MLAGRSAPDFRLDQDEGCYAAINCAGRNIPGGLTLFLNTLVVSKLCRSIKDRMAPDVPFWVAADEGQDLLKSSVIREHLGDAGRLSRRFGTHLSLITQNLSAAVPDARLISLLHSNVGWTWSGRGDPADCSFVKPFLPVTGRRAKVKRSPFEETRFNSESEERELIFGEIANLPGRVGWLLLKGRFREAIKIRTRDLDIPQGRELEEATSAIRRDPTIGQRISRTEYERRFSGRNRTGPRDAGDGFDAALEQAYRKTRNMNAGNGTGS